MTKRRLLAIGLVLAVLVLAAGAAWRLRLLPIAAVACPDHSSEVTALWVGDSYTRGEGVETGDAYSCATSERLGWSAELDAEGSTGFRADGRNRTAWFSPLPDRLAGTVERVPDADVVVVDAGRNDVLNSTPAEVESAATEYLTRVGEAWPDATVVVILPWSAKDASGEPHVFAAAVRSAAESVDAEVIDPVTEGWAGETADDLLTDGIHPDAEAHALVTDRLVDALGD